MTNDARTPSLGRAPTTSAAGLVAATAAVSLAAATVVSTRAACASGMGGYVERDADEEWRIHLGPGHTEDDVKAVYARPEPGQPGTFRIRPDRWLTQYYGPPPEEIVDGSTLYPDTGPARKVARATQFARLAAAANELARLYTPASAIVAAVAACLPGRDDDDDFDPDE